MDFRVRRERKQEHPLNFVVLSRGEIMTAWNKVAQKNGRERMDLAIEWLI